MKRFALILLSVLTIIGLQAQVVSTRSAFEKVEVVKKEKKPRVPIKMEFYAKAGVSLMSTNWKPVKDVCSYNLDIDSKSKVGYDLSFGFMSHFRPSKPSNFYWGAELSIFQVGGELNETTGSTGSPTDYYYAKCIFPSYKYSEVGASLTPSIGWEKAIAKEISLDLHFNPGIFINFKEHYVDYIWEEYIDGEFDYQQDYDVLVGAREYGLFKVGAGVWIKRVNIDLSYKKLIPLGGGNEYDYIVISLGYKF